MRLFTVVFALLLLVTACTDTGDDDADETADGDPTPTATVATGTETAVPDPTPSPTAVEDEGEETPAPSPEPEATETEEDSADLDATVDEIAENVAELRGLELQEELDFSVMGRDELREMLVEEIDLTQSDIDLAWILRLIPDRDADVEQALIDLQTADIYGFYDPETEETYVISEDEEMSALEETILAHEIVHALQDQHFDLGMLDEFGTEYDEALAFTSVVEGDASLVQERYVQEYFDQEKMNEFQQEAMEAQQNEATQEAMEAVPDYYVQGFVFPYQAGPNFMMQAYDDDFSNLNELLEDPPVATYQIMNPEEYLAGELDDPRDVELPDLDERLDDDWELYESGTLGAFDFSYLLHTNGASEPQETLDGWDGDQFAMYERGDDQVLATVSTAWATEEDAREFEEALGETMGGYNEEDGVWSDEGRYHTVMRDGDIVTLVSSTDPDALLDAAEME